MGPFTVKLTFPKAHCCGAGKPGVQLRKRELQDAQGRCLYLGGLPSESREQRILGSVLGESSTGSWQGTPEDLGSRSGNVRRWLL